MITSSVMIMIDKIKYILDERNFERIADTVFSFAYKFIPTSKDDYRDILTEANIGSESDKYIPRVAFYSATVSAIIMIFVAIFIPVITLLLQLNISQLIDILLSLDIGSELAQQPVIQSVLDIVYSISVPRFVYVIIGIIVQPFIILYGFVESISFGLISIVIYLTVFTILFTIGMLIGWYYPIYLSNERERDIDNNLPYSITYMYSIVRGGRDVVGMLEVLSEQQDVYGEVANEAKLIINRTRLGDDIKTALREQAKTTPSDEFEDLLLDLYDLLDHTTDVEQFFQDKTDESLYAAQQAIENKYAFLEYINVFITLLNFLPAMIIVLGITSSIIQGSTATGMFIAVPALIFASNAIIFGILYLLLGDTEGKIPKLSVKEPEVFDQDLEGDKIPDNIKSSFKEIQDDDEGFIDKIIENPLYGFLITLPLSAPYSVLAISQFSFEQFQTAPVSFAIAYIIMPIFLITIGYTVLYELKYRRKKRVIDEMEDMFRNIQDKNRKGMSLIDAIKSETESKRNNLERTLNKYINKTALAPVTVKYALEKAANELNVTRMKRTVRLLTDTIEETGQIETILSIVVDDLKARSRIKKSRVQQANQTVVSILMSDIILLIVFGIIDIFLITQFIAVQEQIASLESARGAASDLANLNFDIVKASMVYATVLVFSMGGLQIGFLRTGNISSGLKYALVMTASATLVLLLI